jgi:hypothetical protein
MTYRKILHQRKLPAGARHKKHEIKLGIQQNIAYSIKSTNSYLIKDFRPNNRTYDVVTYRNQFSMFDISKIRSRCQCYTYLVQERNE